MSVISGEVLIRRIEERLGTHPFNELATKVSVRTTEGLRLVSRAARDAYLLSWYLDAVRGQIDLDDLGRELGVLDDGETYESLEPSKENPASRKERPDPLADYREQESGSHYGDLDTED